MGAARAQRHARVIAAMQVSPNQTFSRTHTLSLTHTHARTLSLPLSLCLTHLQESEGGRPSPGVALISAIRRVLRYARR